MREGSNRRESIENVFERELGVFGTGFAAGDHPLRLLKSRGINEKTSCRFGVESKKSRVSGSMNGVL